VDDQQRRRRRNAQLLASAGTSALLVLSAIVNLMNPHLEPTFTIIDSTGAISHFDEFVSPDGRELTFIATDPSFIISGSDMMAAFAYATSPSVAAHV
jgi:hypothetical protein